MLALCFVVASLLFFWWQSSGYPTQGEICEIANGAKDCERYNIIFSAAWNVSKALDHWSVLITAIATGFIAWFTFSLRRSTDRMWNETKKAADAADLNARAAIALQLPFIRVNPEGFGISQSREVVDGPLIDYCYLFKLIIFNLGETRGVPLEVRCGWTIGKVLAPDPTYTFTKPFKIGTVMEADSSASIELHIHDFPFATGRGLYGRLRKESVNLWFYCCLKYLDFMDNPHEIGFCWRRYETFGAGGLMADATPAYNRKT